MVIFKQVDMSREKIFLEFEIKSFLPVIIQYWRFKISQNQLIPVTCVREWVVWRWAYSQWFDAKNFTKT